MSLFENTFRMDPAGTTLSCTGLDGDRHGLYRLTAYLWIATPGSTAAIEMQPNGVATNLDAERSNNFGTPGNLTTWQIAVHQSSASDNVIIAKIKLFAARTLNGTTVRRGFMSEAYSKIDATTGSSDFRNNAGIWRNNTNNLTSLDFVSTANLAKGSYVYVEQLIPDNALA